MRNLTTSLQPFPAPDDIRGQLERILVSDDFIATDRGRRLLRFLVDETLAGRSQYLKAFTLAQSIFNRSEYFDAQNDPCVRIAAKQTPTRHRALLPHRRIGRRRRDYNS